MYCARCKIDLPPEKFPRDRRKPLGRSYTCKSCKKLERTSKRDQELARWHRYYSPGSDNRKRHMIRSATRRKYGSAKLYKCSNCGNTAAEWHHYTYTIDNVVPLCKNCHSGIAGVAPGL